MNDNGILYQMRGDPLVSHASLTMHAGQGDPPQGKPPQHTAETNVQRALKQGQPGHGICNNITSAKATCHTTYTA